MDVCFFLPVFLVFLIIWVVPVLPVFGGWVRLCSLRWCVCWVVGRLLFPASFLLVVLDRGEMVEDKYLGTSWRKKEVLEHAWLRIEEDPSLESIAAYYAESAHEDHDQRADL